MRISDWSSDVCSSDLDRIVALIISLTDQSLDLLVLWREKGELFGVEELFQAGQPYDFGNGIQLAGVRIEVGHDASIKARGGPRSDGRRVGKECFSPGRFRG